MNSYKVCLIVIYNHNYEKNYDYIQKLYSKRFKSIFHLIPFSTLGRKNVIPVYDNSLFFGNFVANSRKIVDSEDFDFFFYIADDVLLNPVINENNLCEYFGLNSETAYHPYFVNLSTSKNFWLRSLDALNWKEKSIGLELDGLLPEAIEWNKIFEENGYSKKINLKSILIFGLEGINIRKFEQSSYKLKICLVVFYCFSSTYKNFFNLVKWLLKKGNSRLPLVGGYSDIFILPKGHIQNFTRLLGMLSALRLHVELAIPTAMLLQKNLQISNNVKLNSLGETLSAESYWNSDFSRYIFPKNMLYLHPVKVSQLDNQASIL